MQYLTPTSPLTDNSGSQLSRPHATSVSNLQYTPKHAHTRTHTQPDTHTIRHTHTNASCNSTDRPCYPLVSLVVLPKTCHSVVCTLLISAFYPALEDIFHFQRHRVQVTPFSPSFANGLKSRHGLDPETPCGELSKSWMTWCCVTKVKVLQCCFVLLRFKGFSGGDFDYT